MLIATLGLMWSRHVRLLRWTAGAVSLGLMAGALVISAPQTGWAAADSGPAVTVTSPAPDADVADRVRLTANVSDPQGVLRVHFYVDGIQVAVDHSAPYEGLWDASDAASGAHAIKVGAFDASPEHARSVKTISVNVVGGPPPPQPPVEGSGVLWRGDGFCSRKTLHADVGHCPQTGPWDVTGCVPGAPDQAPYSLRSQPGGIGRFEVRQGDQGANGGGDRCEIVQQTRPITGMEPAPGQPPTPGGEVRFFAFDANYDASTQLPDRLHYQTFAQWHQSTAPAGCPTQSPLKIAVTGLRGAKNLEVHALQCYRGAGSAPRILFSEPLSTDTWHMWLFEIKWSAQPTVGYVRIWHNGQLAHGPGCQSDGRCMIATRHSDANGTTAFNHFKIGNYRHKDIQTPTVASYRDVRIGRSRAAVVVSP